MKRIALLLALTTTIPLAAACGAAESTDDDQVTPGPPSFTAQQVIREFRQTPGQPRLLRATGADVAWEQLSFGLDVRPRLQRRYGTFNVYVVEPGNEEAVGSLLTNKETKKPLERDANGIYWELDTLARSYVAYKRYGANVVVAWWSETREPVADGRFARLDGLLTGLETG
ncbi:MAG: hypothetical protein ACRDOS_13360 [Gaiellaceae bacterium]